MRTIYDRLEDASVDWALTGSASFALQGVPAEPHDEYDAYLKLGRRETAETLRRFIRG